MISQTKVNALLGVVAGVADVSIPSYVYLGLCKTEPAAADGKVNDEPTAASYERKLVSGSGTGITRYFGSATGGIIKNNKEIQMKTAREAWGQQYYWFLSESTTGNATIWGKINGTSGVDITPETVPVFYEGELKASIDVPLT